MAMNHHLRLWLSGLISAFLSGVSGVLAVNFIDPSNFNLDNPDKLIKAAVAFGIVGVVNFLKDKPLPDEEDTVHSHKVPMIVLALALTGLTACVPKTPPAPVVPVPTPEQVQLTRQKAVELADAVKALGDTVDKAQVATSAAYRNGLISKQARDVVYQAILNLDPASKTFIEAASNVTSDPSLQATTRQFLGVADRLVTRLEESTDNAVRAAGAALRMALNLLYVYTGGVK